MNHCVQKPGGRRAGSASLLLFAIALLISGCLGGSGSSGFGIAESVVLQRVADDGDCEVFEEIQFCPVAAERRPTPGTPPTPTMPRTPAPEATTTPVASEGTRTPTGHPSESPPPQATPTGFPVASATPSPTPFESIFVPGDAAGLFDELICDTAAGAGTCTAQFSFAAVGFDSESGLRVASRSVGRDDRDWLILVPRLLPESDAAHFSYAVDIEIAFADAGSTSDLLQLVILVFDRDPGPVPELVARLSDTGAQRAFVVPPLSVRSP